jgi:hypothetical protein
MLLFLMHDLCFESAPTFLIRIDLTRRLLNFKQMLKVKKRSRKLYIWFMQVSSPTPPPANTGKLDIRLRRTVLKGM